MSAKRFILVVVPLLALSAGTQAQQLYRCGSTFSQTPCGTNATPTKVYAGTAPDAAQATQGNQLCATEGVSRFGFPDPESTRVKAVQKSGTQVIQYAGQSVVARRYDMVLNVKNSVGAYVGERVYPCFLSEDETRVLAVGEQRR